VIVTKREITTDLAAWLVRYPLLAWLGYTGRLSWWVVAMFILTEFKLTLRFPLDEPLG